MELVRFEPMISTALQVVLCCKDAIGCTDATASKLGHIHMRVWLPEYSSPLISCLSQSPVSTQAEHAASSSKSPVPATHPSTLPTITKTVSCNYRFKASSSQVQQANTSSESAHPITVPSAFPTTTNTFSSNHHFNTPFTSPSTPSRYPFTMKIREVGKKVLKPVKTVMEPAQNALRPAKMMLKPIQVVLKPVKRVLSAAKKR